MALGLLTGMATLSIWRLHVRSQVLGAPLPQVILAGLPARSLLVWVTDSDGTGLQRSGTDRNGYPLNPLWFSQISDPTNLNNTLNFAATCGLPAPVTPQS